MPAKGTVKRDRLTSRVKVAFSDAELSRMQEEARQAGLTQAKYMRQAVLACWGEGKKPKALRNKDRHDLAHAVGALSFQVKKLGTNINQLARQANTGMVPVSRAELQYLLNQHQILMSTAISALERVLP